MVRPLLMELFERLDREFPKPDPTVRAWAIARQDTLTKPPGSLGRLEALAVHLAAWQGHLRPRIRPAAVIVFAADHSVTRFGVSPYPKEVTGAMVSNFVRGGAAASVLARRLDLPLWVVDVGVEAGSPALDSGQHPRLVRAPRVGEVGDLVETDALDAEALDAALDAGAAAVDRLSPETSAVVLGEMGIGNSTVAAALAAALLGGEAKDWVGPGTGARGEILLQKRAAVARAVARVGQVSPAEALRRLGGREVAALVGAAARAAARGMVVLVDGFIVSVAMLALVRLRPEARPALVFAHRSAEPGHARVLEALGAEPLLDLGLRLGEGSGALAAFSLVEAACALHAEMATFDEAAVPDRAP